MQFGGRFSTPVFGPVHALGDQLDRRSIDGMDSPGEPFWKSRITTAGYEPGINILKMFEDLPEESLHHIAVPSSIGV